jgi:ribosomal protein L7/L12
LNPPGVGVCKKCGNAIPREESAPREEIVLPDGDLSEFEKEILGLMKGGKKIEAIKRYREKTGCGLKEAKDAVEALAARYGIESKGVGCAGVLLFLLFLPLAWRLLG